MSLAPIFGGFGSGGTPGGGGGSDTLLLDATFASDDEGFTSGTHVADEGWDFEDGYLSVGASASAVAVDLSEAPTTGVHRMDFSVRIPASAGDSGSSAFFIYALPTSGAIGSTNSLGNIRVLATANGMTLTYGSGASYTTAAGVAQSGWVKVSMVFDLDAATFDIYIADLLWVRSVAFANGSAADFARAAILSQSGAPTVHLDQVQVIKDWALAAESVLVEDDFTVGTGEIEDSQPDTDGANVNKQDWQIPATDLSGHGAFTRSANGLEPDTSANCSALYRTGGEGIWEATFTASAADGIHGALLIRAWGGEDAGDASVVFRYWSASGTPIAVFYDGGTAASGSLSGTSITAGSDYTLKIEARGRFIRCFVNDVEQFGGWVQLGQRGIMHEDFAGPFVDTSLTSVGTDNYVKDWSYTGRLLPKREQKTIGDWTVVSEGGRTPELYNSALAASTQSLFRTSGIQFGHVQEHDMMPFRPEVRTVYDTTNLLVLQQRAPCLSEGGGDAHGDCYLTFRRDQFWVEDRTFLRVASRFAPDVDLRENLWSRDYRHISATGASSAVTKTLSGSSVSRATSALPIGEQRLSAPASGDKVRLTHVERAVLNASGTFEITDRLTGEGDPFTVQLGLPSGSTSAGTTYATGRRVLLETGALSLDDTALQGVRDDIKTPMTPAASVGSLKTDADGDADTDGFNERFGWAEITCDGSGHATFTIDGATTARYYPAIRLHGFASGGSITGLTEGTDYLLDDLGDGNALVQILSVVSASTQYEFTT